MFVVKAGALRQHQELKSACGRVREGIAKGTQINTEDLSLILTAASRVVRQMDEALGMDAQTVYAAMRG